MNMLNIDQRRTRRNSPHLADYKARFAVTAGAGRQFVGFTRSPDARRLADLGFSDATAASLADHRDGAAILARTEIGTLAGAR